MEELQECQPAERMSLLTALPRATLQKMAKELGIKANGKSTEIIANILQTLTGQPRKSDSYDEGANAASSAEQPLPATQRKRHKAEPQEAKSSKKPAVSYASREQGCNDHVVDVRSFHNYPPAQAMPAIATTYSSPVAKREGTSESLILEGQPQNQMTARATHSMEELRRELPANNASIEQGRQQVPGADDDVAEHDGCAPCQGKAKHVLMPEQDTWDGVCTEERPPGNGQLAAAVQASVQSPAAGTEAGLWGAALPQQDGEERDDSGRAQGSREEGARPLADAGAEEPAIDPAVFERSELQQNWTTAITNFAEPQIKSGGHSEAFLTTLEGDEQYLDAVERMVFEGAEVGAAAGISAESPEQQTEKLRSGVVCELQAGQKPPDTISVCNNPFFENSGDDTASERALPSTQDKCQTGHEVEELAEIQREAFERGRRSGLWQGKVEADLGYLEQHWTSFKESSARGWTLPSLDEVKAEGLKLAASGFTTVQTPSLCESSKQAVLQQRRAGFEGRLPKVSFGAGSRNRSGALPLHRQSSPRKSTPLHRRKENAQAGATPSRLSKGTKAGILQDDLSRADSNLMANEGPIFTPGAKAKVRASAAQLERAKRAEVAFAARRAAALAKARKK